MLNICGYWLGFSLLCFIVFILLISITDRYYVIKTGGIIPIRGIQYQVKDIKIIIGKPCDIVMLYVNQPAHYFDEINDLMIGSRIKILNPETELTFKMKVRHIYSPINLQPNKSVICIDNSKEKIPNFIEEKTILTYHNM